MSFNCLMTGVGGQGTVLASKLLAQSAMRSGLFARTSETIGMAQRGGSVVSHVRIGDTASALIPKGSADLIIAFEPSEAVRSLPYLKSDGKCVVAKRPVQPITASLGNGSYDVEKILQHLKEHVHALTIVDGDMLTDAAGHSKTLNVILLGVAMGKGYLEIEQRTMQDAIRTTLPKKLWDINIRALELGILADCEVTNSANE